ncbi:MAG: guanylate kinase [Dehalococcoidia bacterium]|nr:guanylate kinase [Dehalococcoidia bacterium]
MNCENFYSRDPLLIVLSGPSGVGKDAVLIRMKKLKRPFYYVVTATTRSCRPGEKNNVDYHFLAQEEFQRMIDEGQFVEWAKVYSNYYGVPRDEITRGLSEGMDVMLKVDIQGAATIKKVLPQAVFIFLMPPSIRDLERRLKQRSSESSTELALRLAQAGKEIENLAFFDYVIISHYGRLDEVVSQIDAIVTAERCRVNPRNSTL